MTPYKNQFTKQQKPKFKVVSNQAINSLVDNLVKMRCASDVTGGCNARHCCAIFIEKNQSCFKSASQRYQPRKLCTSKERYKERHK